MFVLRILCFVSFRNMSSVHICSNLPWRGAQFNNLSNCFKHHVFALSSPCLPKTAQQWYHKSGKVMKIADVNSKPERSKFEDIQVNWFTVVGYICKILHFVRQFFGIGDRDRPFANSLA